MNKIHFVIVFSLVASFAWIISSEDVSAYTGKGKTSTQDSGKYVQQLNKYANYIHFQPEWKSYPYNIIFDVFRNTCIKIQIRAKNMEYRI